MKKRLAVNTLEDVKIKRAVDGGAGGNGNGGTLRLFDLKSARDGFGAAAVVRKPA